MDASLEMLCADDFGANYKDKEDWTDQDHDHDEQYEETRSLQREMALRIADSGLEAYVDVWDTDDRYSKHTDTYLRFNLRDLPIILKIIEEVGLPGDVLDVEQSLPENLDTYIRGLGWQIQISG